MEALRSSRRPAKRSSSTSTSTSTSYADIFGGPPSYKYTTAPFVASSDDYAEIFGGGGSSSSIPFLDLPPVSDSSDGCFIDYSEIFGARNGGVDFAVDYEDLFNSTRNSSSSSSNGRTSMEAKFSQQNEEVPDLPQEGANKNYKANSVNNTLSSSSNHADDCSKQFNMSYHRANHGSMEDATRGKTHTTQLHAIPGYSCVVDSFSSIQDVKSDNVLDIQMKDPIQTANTMHLNHFTNFKSNEVDLNSNQKESSTKFRAPENFPPNLKHHSRSSSNYSSSSGEMSNPDTTFVSVSDINLRTKPCKVPPPSRAPPKLFSKQENSKTRLYEEETFLKPKLDHQIHYRVGDAKSHGLQGIAKDTSSAAAAMKEAMEQAQARLKSAKELMERKLDKLQNSRKQGHKEATKYGENNGVKAFEEEILFNDGMTEEHLIKEDALDDMNAYKSSQMPYKPGEVSGEWKMDTDFYELINNDTKFKGSKEAFKQDGVEKNTNATVFNEDNRAYSEQAELTYEFSRAEKLDVDKEALERDDDNSKAGTTFREDLSEMPNTNKKNIKILEVAYSSHQQSRTEKILVHYEAQNPVSVEEAPVCIEGENDVESSKNAFNVDEVYHIDEEACQSDVGEENLNGPSVTSMPYEIEKKPEIFLEKDIPNETQNEINFTSTEYALDAKEEVVAVERELNENECKSEGTALASKHEESKNLWAQGVCMEVEDEWKSEAALDGNEVRENSEELDAPSSTIEKGAISANENLDHNEVETSESKSELLQNEKKQCSGETFTEQESTMKLRDLQVDNIEGELKENECKLEGTALASKHEESKNLWAQGVCMEVEDEWKSEAALDGIEVRENSEELEAPLSTIEKGAISANENLDYNEVETTESKSELQQNEKKQCAGETFTEQESTMKLRELQRDNIEGENGKLKQGNRVENSIPGDQKTENLENKETIEREKEQARKAEEEREREREREKDRLAVERATHEAHERAFNEARERAERIAVERVTAEARQRALAEAREKAERASAEALEKALAEKALKEAKLRAERAAVERATAEARERAVEKALAEKAAADARNRSERLSAVSRDKGRKENEYMAGDKEDRATKLNVSSSDVLRDVRFQNGGDVDSPLRCKARLERHQRTVERAAKALAEKNMRDILAQREQAERNRLADYLDADVRRWATGKEGNLRALLSTLQYILGPESGWQPVPLTDVITAAAAKKAYRKATLCVHPDKLQQRGASIQQKYICEKVFDLLKDAWNRFNSEER